MNQTYLDLAAEHSLEQMVDFPTRGDNTLDLVFTSHPSYVERCKPLPPIADKSDHDIVLFDTSHQPVRTRPKRRTIYIWKKANIMEIKRSLQEYYRHFQSQSFSSVDEMWNNIKEEITKTIQDHVPTKRTLAR